MTQSLLAGLFMGVTIAICREMLLALGAALWLRRPRVVAAATFLGIATAEAVLCAIGAWLGGSIASVVQDAGLRSMVAVGLLAGVAGWLVVAAAIGRHGIPGNAVLPDRPVATWVKFAAIGLFSPIPAIIVGANTLVFPGLVAGAAAVALVAGAVIGAAFIRWQWAVATERNRGIRSIRWMHSGVWIGGILLISVFVIRILGR